MRQSLTLSNLHVLLSTVVVAARSRVDDILVFSDPVSLSAVVRSIKRVNPDVVDLILEIVVQVEAVPGVQVGIVVCSIVALRGGVGPDAITAVVRVGNHIKSADDTEGRELHIVYFEEIAMDAKWLFG